METNKAIIEFKNIVKTYGSGEAKTFALNGVSLTINKGEFIAIMGASGSGKSTSMNMIGCLDKPSSGEYLFNGINVEIRWLF
jgi:putative ABC transport system ATP-binding protein